jgi:hypothetical protein
MRRKTPSFHLGSPAFGFPGRWLVTIVERFGGNVGTIGPANGFPDFIDAKRRKYLRVISNRFKYRTPKKWLEVDIPFVPSVNSTCTR